jgi:hypothetical protein
MILDAAPNGADRRKRYRGYKDFAPPELVIRFPCIRPGATAPSLTERSSGPSMIHPFVTRPPLC